MNYIDWKLVFDVLKSISIIIASLVAIYGINSWRREIRWKSKYHLAEEALSLFYEVQDKIFIIRNPAGNSNEGRTRKKGENENPDDSEVLDSAYVVIERFENNKESFYKMKAIKYRFCAVFGKDCEKPFHDITKLTNKVLLASRLLGTNYWKNQGKKNFTDDQFKKHLKEMYKYEAIIWERHDEDDELKKELLRIINEIENICDSVLKKK